MSEENEKKEPREKAGALDLKNANVRTLIEDVDFLMQWFLDNEGLGGGLTGTDRRRLVGVVTVSGTAKITSTNTNLYRGTVNLNTAGATSPVLILPANWAELITNTAGGNVIYPTNAISDPSVVTVGP